MVELNKIYCGDSKELLKQIDDESIDLVVTSPPYNDLRKYHGTLNNWNENTFQSIATELIRILKDGGIIVWNINDKVENGSRTCTSFRQCLYFVDNGLNLNDTMIWNKTNPCPVVRQPRYNPCFEYMFVFSKGKPKTFNPIMRECKSANKHYKSTVKIIGGENGRKEIDYFVNKETVDYNVWDMSVAQNKTLYEVDGEKIKHPAVFPYELPFRHIKSWTNEGDIVLDPFAGSGTTLLAARDLNRNYIGIEQNEQYCKIIEQRLRNINK